MPVNHKMKLVLVHIPRTGGRAIQEALNMEVEIGDKHKKVSWYRKIYPGYILFAVRRDFKERKESGKRHWEWDKLFDKPNGYFLNEPVDYVLNYNNLQSQLNIMLKELGRKGVRLNRVTI